ncbi:MAG: HNH endonuclease signature motif containing protein [Candidatus Aenigmatarchaeota archaeon]
MVHTYHKKEKKSKKYLTKKKKWCNVKKDMSQPEEYEKNTRKKVQERDGNRCFLCKKRPIHVHEIVPRSRFGTKQYETLFSVKNRVCLCPACHMEAHNYTKRIELLALLEEKYGYEYKEKEFKRYRNNERLKPMHPNGNN